VSVRARCHWGFSPSTRRRSPIYPPLKKNPKNPVDNPPPFVLSPRRNRTYRRTAAPLCPTSTRQPPARNADVESSHATIENEFYDLETFATPATFLAAANTYQTWFNFARKNRSRHDKPPAQLLQEKSPTTDPRIMLLPPILLTPSGGQHLPESPDALTPNPPYPLRWATSPRIARPFRAGRDRRSLKFVNSRWPLRAVTTFRAGGERRSLKLARRRFVFWERPDVGQPFLAVTRPM
jgi:hypothetical protein